MLRRLGAALLASTGIAASALAVTAAAPAAAPQAQAQIPGSSALTPYLPSVPGRCAPNIVINIPGGANTFGSSPDNLPMGAYSRDVGTRLRLAAPDRVIDRYVGYDSIPGGAYTYEQTRDNGLNTARAALAQEAAACPNSKFALFGYSMGADIGARLTQEISQGKGPIAQERLTSAVFMANPNRGVPGVQQAGGAGPTEGAYGALPGGYGPVTNRVLDICRPGDIVCDTRDSGRLLAQVFAQTAILALKLPVDQLNANVAKLPPQEQINFYTQLPANALGTILHTDYYTVNGSGLATDYITSHLG
ncbi:cutinase family protein [Corynebacterium heidelbergense]|uniref:Cutinase n=1 Tax=Corynebacterium heidelbergense TaxID=2055947 RepID=A0A364V5E1_9CORY|nr:cutinase family protein [Corynebacterium heidelbergense]RAV31847.1 hypothetical protein DLJ54_06250 [Corynebacterium heidelbergense]